MQENPAPKRPWRFTTPCGSKARYVCCSGRGGTAAGAAAAKRTAHARSGESDGLTLRAVLPAVPRGTLCPALPGDVVTGHGRGAAALLPAAVPVVARVTGC